MTSLVEREAAVGRMSEGEAWGVVWSHVTHRNIWLAAVRRVSTLGRLAELAERHPDASVRHGARYRRLEVIGTIEDARVLSGLAGDPDPDIRAAALRRIKDQTLLKRAIEFDDRIGDYREPTNVRLAALTNLHDEAALVRATDDSDQSVRQESARRLRSPSSCALVAASSADPAVRELVLPRVDDPELLKRIAVNDPAASVRELVLPRVDDPGLLKRIAVNDPAASVRAAALRKIDDQQLMARVLCDDESEEFFEPDPRVRLTALTLVTDQDAIDAAATYDLEVSVQLAAVERASEEALCEIAADDGEYQPYAVRKRAIALLNTPEVLLDVAEDDEDYDYGYGEYDEYDEYNRYNRYNKHALCVLAAERLGQQKGLVDQSRLAVLAMASGGPLRAAAIAAISDDTLRAFFNGGNSSWPVGLLDHPVLQNEVALACAGEALLAAAAQHPRSSVRIHLCRNPNADANVLGGLLFDEDPDVANAAKSRLLDDLQGDS